MINLLRPAAECVMRAPIHAAWRAVVLAMLVVAMSAVCAMPSSASAAEPTTGFSMPIAAVPGPSTMSEAGGTRHHTMLHSSARDMHGSASNGPAVTAGGNAACVSNGSPLPPSCPAMGGGQERAAVLGSVPESGQAPEPGVVAPSWTFAESALQTVPSRWPRPDLNFLCVSRT